MTEFFKGVAVAEFKVPGWSVVVAVLAFCFNVGMTYKQFEVLKDQTSIVVADSKTQLAAIHEQGAKMRAVEERIAGAAERTQSLERRITTLEDFIIRKSVVSSSMRQ